MVARIGGFLFGRPRFAARVPVLGVVLLSALALLGPPAAQAAAVSGQSKATSVPLPAAAAAPGTAVAIAPTRFLDTRTSSGNVVAGDSVNIKVAGISGIPADASAVVINLTVTGPTWPCLFRSFGYVTAYPYWTNQPDASNVNFAAGQTVANQAVVPVGADGKITVQNFSNFSEVNLIVDVTAYFQGGTPQVAGAFGALPSPTRFLDTRKSAKVQPGGSVSFQVGGANGIPADAAAVVMNLTVTEPTSNGFITAHPSGSPKPNASNVNYKEQETVPNLTVVPLGPDGKVTLTNTSTGSVQLIADVAGYFRGGAPGPGAYGTFSPTRFLDTRTSTGPVAGFGTVSIQVANANGMPANVAGVWVNLTVTEAEGNGYLTAYASGTPKPGTSNLNYGGSWTTVANMAYVPVGADGKVTVANMSDSAVQIIADVSGYVMKGPGA